MVSTPMPANKTMKKSAYLSSATMWLKPISGRRPLKRTPPLNWTHWPMATAAAATRPAAATHGSTAFRLVNASTSKTSTAAPEMTTRGRMTTIELL